MQDMRFNVMVRPTPVCRRQADPLIVQKLWTAINSIRSQKQVANLERLSRYVQREYQLSAEEIECQLNYAVADQLISNYKAVAVKGNNLGAEQEGYRIQPADETENMGDHDWYCYDCHRPGPVLECAECWRVFHQTCTDDDLENNSDEMFVCAVCKDVKKQSRVKRKELNRLLGFTVQHLKERLRDLPWFQGQDIGMERFVYHYVDFGTMEAKTEARKYKYLEQFYADARTILHNVFVCFGDSGPVPDLARLMIRDCRYDLDEIRQCKDCYFHSNARSKDWFCQPCHPAHELVYAKQKGFSYWPAKVIKVTQEGYDVRFFGGLHQRALIPSSSIKPLDASPKVLALKRTAGFLKAVKELERHQELLQLNGTDLHDDDNQSGGEDLDDEQEKNDTSMVVEKHMKVHHKKTNKRRCIEDLSITSSEPRYGRHSLSNTSEDSHSVVTSSEDNVKRRGLSRASLLSDTSSPTSRKLLVANARRPHKSTQTDAAESTSCLTSSDAETETAVETMLTDSAMAKCSCDAKKAFASLKDQLERDHQVEKNKAIRALEDKLRKEFEEDKQRAVSRAMAQAQRDIESARKQAEDRCKDDFAEEMKKIAQKHKSEISATKKKQWCYNCEEEAMYHCCWNTSYCSIKCQQQHWHVEHKRQCRRKRN